MVSVALPGLWPGSAARPRARAFGEGIVNKKKL